MYCGDGFTIQMLNRCGVHLKAAFRSNGEGMATHSSVLAWRIPRTEEPGGLQSTGLQESDTTEQLKRERYINYFSGKE